MWSLSNSDYYRHVSTGSIESNTESPTLSLRSLPVRSHTMYNKYSDNESVSSMEFLDISHVFSTDSQSLSDLSPASEVSPRISQGSRWGKTKMAPPPPIVVYRDRMPSVSKDDSEIGRRPSRQMRAISSAIKLRSKSSETTNSDDVSKSADFSPPTQKLSTAKRLRLKARMKLALQSPRTERKNSKKSKEGNVRHRKNGTIEPPNFCPSDYGFGFIPDELIKEVDFEVQRIPEYDKYLNDLLEETDSSHPDYDDLTRAATRVRNMVREHEDEFGTNENQIEMDRIQKKFPNDDLQLGDATSQTVRSLSHRRRSAPGAVLFKTLGHKSKSTGNLLSNVNMGKKELNNFHHPSRSIQNNIDRHYVMEGCVEFSTGMHTQERYLFLFNDLLLVAKQKSSTTFKLKHRIRVCEIWLATCIYDVTELTRPPERSFVIGWPTSNAVATFKTAELKDEWLNKLNDQIEEEKAKDIPETVKIKVKNRDLDKTCTVEVDNRVTAEELVKKCMNQFNFQSSDAKDYKIWVRSGKDEIPCSLIGHELPYSIHQSHVRDIYAKREEPMIPDNCEKILLDAPADMKLEFILKHSKKSPKKSYDENTKVSKKNKKSPLINFFRRHRDDKNNNNSPPGKLFGHPLSDVVEGGLPHSVMELLRILFREGPYTKGILRKSPNAKLCRELRQKLDDGEDCITDDCPALVIGALLKDYLRSLPQCLLIEDLYDDWLSLNEEDESPEKLQKVKQLLMKLPVYHFDMLRHLMCVLYHIDKKNDINMMTSYNLAVCIAPSILWSKIHGDPIKALATTNSPQAIVQYLIDNCGEVFGEESLFLFGPPVEQKMRQDSSTDSDSMHSVLSMPDSGSGSALRRDDSSIDSLEREFYPGDMDSSPNLAKSHLSPSNLSRDSGLTLSDTQLYDDDGSSVEMLNDRGKNYTRSVSHFYDRDSEKVRYDNVCSRSYDHPGFGTYDISNPKPPPRKNRRKGSEQSDQSPDMEQYRHQTRYSGNGRSTLSQSLSTDALSQLTTNSQDSYSGEQDSGDRFLQDYKNLPKDYGTLVKSPSGAHLFFDEDISHIVTEIDISSNTPTRSNNQKLVRQASVTSTPPMSPESKYSNSSSFDSFLTDSSASYLSRQQSRDTVRSDRSSWYISEDQNSQDKSNRQKSQENMSTLSRNNRNLTGQQGYQNMQYYPSPNSAQNNQHANLAVTRSFPLEYSTMPKGSGSSTAKEAEDIIDPSKISISVYDSNSRQRSTSPRYSNSPSGDNGSVSNMPLKQITKYSTGLGTSPPPKVVLHHMQQKSTPRRENTPMRASHDSAIVSQVRRSSFDCVEADLWRRNSTDQSRSDYNYGRMSYHSPTLSRSESDPDLNRSCSGSPDSKNRPDKPPSYDEALQRNFMMKHGIPLEISEQDSEKQKEVSAKARQLYEQSLRQYMQEHLGSPSQTKTMESVRRTPQKKEVIVEREEEEEGEGSSDGEEMVISVKDPKKIYEESLKRFNEGGENTKHNSSVQTKYGQSPSSLRRPDTNHLSVPVCNLQRSYSDSADHTDKLDRWRRRSPREHSPLAQEQPTLQRGGSVETDPYIQRLRESSPNSHRENSPNRSSLSHSSSSVSNSSSDTVIENTNNPPYRRERTDSSPTLGRHYFRKADSAFLQQYNQKNNLIHKDDSSSVKSRDSSLGSNYSYRGRDSNQISVTSNRASSVNNQISNSRKEEYRDNNKSVSSHSDSQQISSSSVHRNEPSYRRQLTPHRENVVSRNMTENQKLTSVSQRPQSQQQKTQDTSTGELPWSVKQLRSKFQGTSSQQSDNSRTSSPVSRPPPPPYQPPPPFRRSSDTTRASISSNSSSSTDRSSKHFSAHKYGGPQARDSFSSSDDSDVSSRCSGHHRRDSSNSSDDLTKWRFTDVSYV